MILQNNTSIQIECITDEGKIFSIPPKCEINVKLDKSESAFEIHHLYKSDRNKLFGVDNVYNIVIDSKIGIVNCGSDSRMVVSGEIVHFDLGYVYDKFFFYCQNCRMISESCCISNLIKLKELGYENRKNDSFFERITTFFLSGGFWSSTGLFVIFKLAFWANDWNFPLWLIVLFWLFGYVIQLIGEKANYKYIFKKQPKLLELSKYTSTEYVMSYFRNSSREWIGDDRMDL